MKKIKKKIKKKSKKKNKKKVKKKRVFKKKTFKSKLKKIRKRKKSFKKPIIKGSYKGIASKTIKKDNILSKIIKFQFSLKPKMDIKLNLNLEKYIQSFFDKIANTISDYKVLKDEEKKRIRIEELEKIEKNKIQAQKDKIQQEEIKIKLQEKALKDEAKIEKQRTKDIKLFLRKEQALLRIEQAEKQKQFLTQIKLESQIEKFRIREVKELEKLEKISLREQREDYAGLQERIEKLKEKYRIIRDQKIRERVEALGVEIEGDEDRDALLQKEKEFTIARQKIEFSLESYYRSASSLVFQLNKRYVTRHMSILRCIDRRFETGEIFIRWDEDNDENWLILIYIKDNSPHEGIVIEDKTNPEKNNSYEFKASEIFKASDLMVDCLTQLIAKKRNQQKIN
tara:strand:+ start:171 stop:1361 length:1191 start_codon:yes stop_codon:yes gene_type:complete